MTFPDFQGDYVIPALQHPDRHALLDARIVPPTAPNLWVIERDLGALAQKLQDLLLDQLKWKCEQLVFSYVPCISCSCHVVTQRDG